MRCKFKLYEVVTYDRPNYQTGKPEKMVSLEFGAVRPDAGEAEDVLFGTATPSGNLKVQVKPECAEGLVPGRFYYLDISEVAPKD